MARTGRLPPADISTAKARALKSAVKAKSRPAVKKQAVVRSPKDAMMNAPGASSLSPRSVVKALGTLRVAIMKLEIVNGGARPANAVLAKFESVQALAKLQNVEVKNRGPQEATAVLAKFESVQALTKLQVAFGEVEVKNRGAVRAGDALKRFQGGE